jgi:hypothetical protein
MRLSFPKKLALVTALIVGTFGVLGARPGAPLKSGSIPVVFEICPTNPGPNTQVTITVVLDSITPTGQVVTIGSTDPYAFIDLPPQVTVPAGESSYTFVANTSSVYSGWTVIAAVSNGGTAFAIPQ